MCNFKKSNMILILGILILYAFVLDLEFTYAFPKKIKQAGGGFIHLNYGEFAIQNFTTFYTNTKVKFKVNVLPLGSKVNFSVFDHKHYNDFLLNKTIPFIFKVINAQAPENYTVIVREMGKYCVLIENNDPAQERIGTAVFRVYNDDPYFNPGTIPIYILFIMIIIIVSLIGIALFLKFR
ncbi:MAG: hypothetical protein ACFE8B_15890 [Candidatus Hermodarchaeota archaeon]